MYKEKFALICVDSICSELQIDIPTVTFLICGRMFTATYQLYISVLAISILHAILPNHWLPIVAISKNLNWTGRKTAMVTMLAALAHSLSTVIIGILLALGGMKLNDMLPYFRFIAAGLLILLGILFLWRHQHHMHFHLRKLNVDLNPGMSYILFTLLLAMFLSPCLEVGAFFLMAGTESMLTTWIISAIYTITSALGMTLFAWLAMQGLKRFDWHKLEHVSGLISGGILILTGIMFLVIQ
jgi:cytochrome c biogenesis protein CcdA